MNHRKLHMDGQKVRPVEAINLAEKWPKRGLSWLGFSWFFGSKLLVYRHTAEKLCHLYA